MSNRRGKDSNNKISITYLQVFDTISPVLNHLKTSINHFYTLPKLIKNNYIILNTLVSMNQRNHPSRNNAKSPETRQTPTQAQSSREAYSDPLHEVSILEKLRKENGQVNSQLSIKDAQIQRLLSRISALQSNKSCQEIIDNIERKRQQHQKDYNQAVQDINKRLKAEADKMKEEYKVSKQSFKFSCAIDTIQERPLLSKSHEVEINQLKNQVNLLKNINQQQLAQLQKLGTASSAAGEFEGQIEEMRRNAKLHEKKISQSNNQLKRTAEDRDAWKKRAQNSEREIGSKKEAIKKLTSFIKRTCVSLQTFAKDQKTANPAKKINEGAQLQDSKLNEFQRYQTLVLQSIQEQVKTLNKANEDSRKQINTLNVQKGFMEDQKNAKQAELKNEQEKSLLLRNKITELQNNLQAEKSLLKTTEGKITQHLLTISQQKEALTKHQQQIKNLTDIGTAKTKTINELTQLKQQNQTTIKTQSETIISLNKKVSELTAENAKKDGQLNVKVKELQKATINIQTLERQRNGLADSLEKANKSLSSANDKIRILQQSQIQLKDSLKKQQIKTKDLTLKLEKANSDIFSLNDSLNKQKENYRKGKDIIDRMNKALVVEASQYFTGRPKQLQNVSPQGSGDLQREIDSVLDGWKQSYNAAKFFNGSEVVEPHSISFIIDAIQQYVRERPISTKLIYRFDPLNERTNFHRYFDGVPNLLVVIHLSNGNKIGGFTSHAIAENNVQRPGRGFIFNLSYQKAYYMRNDPRMPVAGYDTYYFLLGNAEIRLRSQEKRVFSNFGIANSTFDNETDLRTKFLAVSELTNNDLPIQTYEFYEVRFE